MKQLDRELEVGLETVLRPLGAQRDRRVKAVYGGVSMDPQITALRKGVDIVVGTPCRLIDLIERRLLLCCFHLADQGGERLWGALLDTITANGLHILQDVLTEADHTPDRLAWEEPLDILELV